MTFFFGIQQAMQLKLLTVFLMPGVDYKKDETTTTTCTGTSFKLERCQRKKKSFNSIKNEKKTDRQTEGQTKKKSKPQQDFLFVKIRVGR